MSGIVNSAGSKSGVISEHAPEIHEWLLSASFDGSAFTDWNAMTGWVVMPTTYGYSTIGGDMTESSGVFTFPRTGVYFISHRLSIKQNNGTNKCAMFASTTINNGSSWGWGQGSCQITHAGSMVNSYSTNTGDAIFNVTDTSTHKIKFIFGATSAGTDVVTVTGSTSGNDGQTSVKFIRLGNNK